ncbi:alpha/beta hydrolase [Mucilaginibacter sp. 44-25]|uniref:alpha/beta hydrolase n=1 Tax=Mucilaginibacter sp. 44-25 TaxID=1895794 RepID=UPI00095F67BB|nr:alpha/beta hydrolase [Mucilaginibacter sp. 44-25]OJW17589.1 MAG: alpha/beta hydrolase [Mucilaginibacter sp. 44-25]
MKAFFTVLVLACTSMAAFAQQSPIPLYPNGVPNAKPTPANYIENTNETAWITKVSVPTLTPYWPAKGTANGTAVVVCPGGGYAGLASAHEGMAIAQAFNKIGVTAFVLKYRLPNDSIMTNKSIGPLQDAQRAIQIVRQNAARWNINPNRIGIIGFSAGGHLASTAGTHFDKPVIDNKDNISVRPDFMMLIYPVITFGEKTHAGSRENLIGKNPSQQQLDLYSNEKQVTAATPPTFMVHAEDDDVVPVENALMMYNALLQNKVPAEMHLFPKGGHGFGLNNPRSKAKWFDWAKIWMDDNGWLVK